MIQSEKLLQQEMCTLSCSATGGTSVSLSCSATGQSGTNTLTVPKGSTISYTIPAYGSASSKSGSVIMDSNKTLTATYSSSESYTDVSFSQPTLSANGTLGGTSFAVTTSKIYQSSREGWRAFDKVDSGYWATSTNSTATKPHYLIFYNPNALKCSQINITMLSAYYGLKEGNFYGSNSNGSWNLLATFSSTSASASPSFTVSNPQYFYKYHKIEYTKGSGSVQNTKEIYITATYQTTTTTYYWSISIS